MKKCRIQTVLLRYTWLLCLGVLTLYPELGRAQTYTLPGGTLPSGCTRSGSIVTCSGYKSFSSSEIINVTAPTTLLLNGAQFNGTRVNEGGSAANLVIQMQGGNSLGVQANTRIVANITSPNIYASGADNIHITGTQTISGSFQVGGTGSRISGAVNAGSIQLGNNTTMAATLDSPGQITIGNNSTITANITSGNRIGLGSSSTVSANLIATGQIEIGSFSTVISNQLSADNFEIRNNVTITSASVTAVNTLTLGASSVITITPPPPAVRAPVTARVINIRENATIHGNVIAVTDVNISQGGRVNGSVNAGNNLNASSSGIRVDGPVTVGNDINLGQNATVLGPITGGGALNASSSGVTIVGDVNVVNNVNLGSQVHLTGNVTTTNGNINMGGNGDIYGNLSGNQINIQNGDDIWGSVQATGQVSNQGHIHGNVNANGPVYTNNGRIDGYVNAPNYQTLPPGNVGGPTCDQNVNVGPCSGGGPVVQFYRIEHTGTALTCEAAPITVRACADATCATGVSLTGDVTVRAGTFTAVGNFSASSTALVSLPISTVGSYTLSLDAFPQAPTGSLQCWNGSTSSCQINTVNAALRWQNIVTQVAGAGFSATIQSIRTDTNTGACVSAIQGVTQLDVGVDCIDPGLCTGNGSLLSIGGTSITEMNTYTAIPVSFSSAGIATLNVNYGDAGSIQLHARANIGSLISGVSNVFVVRPATIAISISNPVTYGSGVFARAGDDLDITLSARSATNQVTPNFGKESSPQRLVLASTVAVDTPVGGTPGTVENRASFTVVPGPGGEFRSTQVRYSEVGTVLFTAEIESQDYLGTGNLTAPSAATGRFVPWDFYLEDPDVEQACSIGSDAFSYLGQPFNINATVTARNRGGDTTLNYPDVATPAVIMLQARDETAPVTVLSSRITPSGQSLSWMQGEASLDGVDFTLIRKLPDYTPDGPFDDLSLAAIVTEQAWSTQYVPMAAADFNEAEAACIANNSCNAKLIEDSLKFRFGRLALLDTYGPETDPAQVTLLAQYWDGTRFIQNNLDVCTAADSTKLTITENLSGLSTGAVGTPGPMSNGRSPFDSLFWTAPDQAGQIRFSYEAPDWLTFENPDNVNGNPTATAEFGQYGGHDRVIHWQRLQ